MKRVIHIRTSKNETSKRVIPLNDSAFESVDRMLKRADMLGTPIPHTTSGAQASTTGSSTTRIFD